MVMAFMEKPMDKLAITQGEVLPIRGGHFGACTHMISES